MKQPDNIAPEIAPRLCDLRVDIVQMKCDILEAIWRRTVYMTALLTALLVTVLGTLAILIVRL